MPRPGDCCQPQPDAMATEIPSPHQCFAGFDPGGTSESFRGSNEHQWWSRTWVVQELLLARRAYFVCGNEQVSWPNIKWSESSFHHGLKFRILEAPSSSIGRLLQLQNLCDKVPGSLKSSAFSRIECARIHVKQCLLFLV